MVRLALAALPVGVILWLTFVQPGRRATKQQRCCLRGVVLTEIVALGDSVLVGYRGGWGSWLTADPDAAVVRVRTGLRDVGGQIFLPELVQDARAMELLYRWCEQETPLVSVVSRGRRLELRDPSGRHAVVAELSLTR